MKQKWVCLMISLFCLCNVQAEMRIWSDKKGNTIEADYINIIGSKVALKTQEGKNIKVPISGLCDADRKYLAEIIPPKIKIEVDTDKDRDTVDSYSSSYGSYNYERKSETIKCTAVLKKTNQEPTNRKFKAHMYVIGKETSRPIKTVLSKVEHEFDFKQNKTTSFHSDPVTVEYTKSDYASEGGFRYDGYIVFVEDSELRIIAIESSNSGYEKNLHKLKKLKERDKMDDDFDKVNTRTVR